MNEYLTWLNGLIREYSYSILFFGLLLENVLMLGFIIPGVSILLLTGFFAAEGNMNLLLCIIFGTVGTIAGDNINYLLGKYGGKKIPFIQKLLTKNAHIIAHLKEQNVFYFLFFHFPVYLRTVFPLSLGAVGYPFTRWIWIDTLGAILFNTTFILLGYLIGRSTGAFTDSVDIGNQIGLVFSVLFGLWIAWLVWKFLKARRQKKQ